MWSSAGAEFVHSTPASAFRRQMKQCILMFLVVLKYLEENLSFSCYRHVVKAQNNSQAHRTCQYPVAGSVEGQVRCSSEQSALEEGVPTHEKEVGAEWSLRSLNNTGLSVIDTRQVDTKLPRYREHEIVNSQPHSVSALPRCVQTQHLLQAQPRECEDHSGIFFPGKSWMLFWKWYKKKV